MRGVVGSQEAYENLANAIVKSAAVDYRKAIRGLLRKPESQSYREDAERLEKFFRSGWYEMLTDVDGEYLIKRLWEDEREKRKRRHTGNEHNVELPGQGKSHD